MKSKRLEYVSVGEKFEFDKFNEELKGWTSSLKKQEHPPERTKMKEENCLEDTKRKSKQAALEWDDLDIQSKLKSFMYVDRSLRSDAKKDKLIDELNFKKCMQLNRIKKQVICLYYIQTKKSYHSS